MQPVTAQRWCTTSADDTRALGARLGEQAQGGDFVACCGVLGAGKTTFIQGFVAGLGVAPDAYVRSPTFVLVHEYVGRLPVYHVDFYRLSHWTEVQDLGFEDYLVAGGVVVVEWADKFPELLPAARLDVCMHLVSSTRRCIDCTAYGALHGRYLRLMT